MTREIEDFDEDEFYEDDEIESASLIDRRSPKISRDDRQRMTSFNEQINAESLSKGFLEIRKDNVDFNGQGKLQIRVGFIPITDIDDEESLKAVIVDKYYKEHGHGTYYAYPCDPNKKRLKQANFAVFKIKPNQKDKELLDMEKELERMEKEIELEKKQQQLDKVRGGSGEEKTLKDEINEIKSFLNQSRNGSSEMTVMMMQMMQAQKEADREARKEREEQRRQDEMERKHEIELMKARIEEERRREQEDRKEREHRWELERKEEKERLEKEESRKREEEERRREQEERREELRREREREERKERIELQRLEAERVAIEKKESEARMAMMQKREEQARKEADEARKIELEERRQQIQRENETHKQMIAMMAEQAKSKSDDMQNMIHQNLQLMTQMTRQQLNLVNHVQEKIGIHEKGKSNSDLLGSVINTIGEVVRSQAGQMRQMPANYPQVQAPQFQQVQQPEQPQVQQSDTGNEPELGVTEVSQQEPPENESDGYKLLYSLAQNDTGKSIIGRFLGYIKERIHPSQFVEELKGFGTFGKIAIDKLYQQPWDEIKRSLLSIKIETQQGLIPLIADDNAKIVHDPYAIQWWNKFQEELAIALGHKAPESKPEIKPETNESEENRQDIEEVDELEEELIDGE